MKTTNEVMANVFLKLVTIKSLCEAPHWDPTRKAQIRDRAEEAMMELEEWQKVPREFITEVPQ